MEVVLSGSIAWTVHACGKEVTASTRFRGCDVATPGFILAGVGLLQARSPHTLEARGMPTLTRIFPQAPLVEIFLAFTQYAQRPIPIQVATRGHHPTTKTIRLSFQSLPVPSNIPQITSTSILPCRTAASTLCVIQAFLRTGRRQEAVHVAQLRLSGSSRRTVPDWTERHPSKGRTATAVSTSSDVNAPVRTLQSSMC